MTRTRSLSLGQVLAGVSVAAVAVVVVPLGVSATTASWPDSEWVHGAPLGTQTLDCGTTTGFASTASGRFLSGELLGTDLDTILALEGVRTSVDAAGTPTVDPADALDQGSTPPTYTYTDPLEISLLGGIAGLDLTGLEVGLPVGSAGAVNQYAQASGLGTAAGASGLVSDSGGVLVSQYAADDTLPEPATILLSSLLPAVTGIADPELEVGAVGASSQLDGCAALRSILWNDGPAVEADREYGIAGLDLALESAVLGSIITDTNTAVTSINAALNGLLGPSGGIATAINGQLNVGLGSITGVSLGATTGTVTLSGLDITGAVTPLLTAPLNDPYVSIDLSAGTVDVDLAALLNGPSGLNGLGPNTELLLNAAVVDNIVNRVGDLLDTRVQQITNAITTAIRAATLTVNLSTPLRLVVLGSPVQVANVAVTLNTTLAALFDGTATFGVSLNVLSGLSPAAELALSLVEGLLNTAITGLKTSLVSPVATVIANAVLGTITTLGSTLAGRVTQVVDALAAVLAPLPGVLSITVNVQPDQPGAPDPGDYIPQSGDSTAEYTVTALRLGLLDALGTVGAVEFGRASAGPVTAP
ncbi:choice-of-anchor G family protein [Cnuibacter physcomitrellae]|uniref:choice-of-anchor G family protein n=1 Tax=Cnuibacter physcomitrellae TaxID=1619308 RepID=UPI002175EDDF|nr:choice-of-anchor G family protein [Cnuibacter physcomitrellae]MCS5498624.1 choice-of-anchor G family protein [Cnuibacter physcomitrellae]